MTATRSVPWLRVFVEGVVIVGSILLAFGIEAAWDGVQERADEQEMLSGMALDFTTNLSELRATIEVLEVAMDRTWRVTTMTGSEISAVPADSAGDYLQALWAANTFDSQDATVEGLIASGALGVISDTRLRNMLVRWRSGVADASEEAADVRSVSLSILQRMGALGGPWSWEAAVYPHPEPDFASAAGDVEVLALSRAKRVRTGAYVLELRPLAALADSVLALVESNRR
jgi:hypothetical protein